MSKIVTQDKLNEMTGMSIDYGKGGGIVLTTKPQLVSGVAQLRLVTTSQINQLKKKIQLQTKTYSLLMRRQVVYTLLAVVPMLKFQLQTAMRILHTQLEEVKQLDTDLIYVDSNWYAIGSNGTKRLLLQNTASTFDQSNKILDLPDYSRQVIKINT